MNDLRVATTVLVAVLVIGAGVGSSRASECVEYGATIELAGRVTTPDRALDVAVDGSFAYVAATHALEIADVTDPLGPTIVGSLAMDACSVAIAGTWAYVGGSQLTIVDVSDPSAPAAAGALTFPEGDVTSVAVAADGHVVVGVRTGGGSPGIVRAIDVTDPALPVVVGTVDLEPFGTADDMVAEGDRLYVAAGSLGMVIVDISDPTALAILGSTGGLVRGVDVAGGVAFLASEDIEVATFLQTIDVSNPRAPTLMATLDVDAAGWAEDVVIVGDHAYVLDAAESVRVVDVSDPAAPVLLGAVETGGVAGGGDAFGSYLYVADRYWLQIVDITNPDGVSPIASLDTPGRTSDVTLDASGTIAYVTDGFLGLNVMDVSIPEFPALLGQVDTPGDLHEVVIDDDLAYVADGPEGLQVIDVSTPSAPVLLGGVDTPSGAAGLDVAGDYAYVADSFAGLQIVDVSLPSTPVIVGNAPTFRARGVRVVGSYAFVADADEGLKVVDVSDPTSPLVVSTLATPGSYADKMFVDGDLLYLGDGTTLVIIDIADALAPAVVGWSTSFGVVDDVIVRGGFAYLANTQLGLQVLDVTDPSAPEVIGSAGWTLTGRGIDATLDHVFLAGGDGFLVYPSQCPLTTDVVDVAAVADVSPLRLSTWPNPARSFVALDLLTSDADRVEYRIHDVTGRRVRSLVVDGATSLEVVWDGRDDAGVPSASGVYFVEAHGSDGVVARGRVSLVR